MNSSVIKGALKRGSKLKPIDHDFVPYAFHYAEDTLTTTSGSLVQVIKISQHIGTVKSKHPHEALRSILDKHGKSGNLAFWFFNIRETEEILDAWPGTNDFSDIVHKSYFKSNLQSMLCNCIYVAIVTKPFNEPLIDFVGAIFPGSVAKRQTSDFKAKKTLLDAEVAVILEKISEEFICKRLGIEFTDEGAFSEIIEFIWRIMSGINQKFAVGKYDISRKLSELNIEFGSNIFMSEYKNRKNFGVVLEVKNYNTAGPKAIQLLMQLECDFILTEYLNYVKTRKDISRFARQSYVITVSADEEFLGASGLYDYINAMASDPSSRPFCEHKLVITLTAGSHAALKEKIGMISSACAHIGLLLIRHDLRLEELYWMTLPANFQFVTGTKLLPSGSVPGFVDLNSESYQNLQDTPDFRSGIATFYTMRNNPFNFSFQKDGHPGHMLIIGYDITFRASITNFLISESRKLGTKCLILDSSGASTIFVNAFSGSYRVASLNPALNTLKINPFRLKNTDFNRETIVGILRRMVGRTIIPEETFKELLNRASDILLGAPDEHKNMSSVEEILKTCGNDALRWLEGGPFAHFITDGEDEGLMDISGVNFADILNYSGCTQVLIYHLLRQYESVETDLPRILVMEEILQMCTAFNSEDELRDWANRLVSEKFVMIFGSSTLRGQMAEKVSNCIAKSICTVLMLPNSNMGVDNQTCSIFNISNADKSTILKMPSLTRHLLIKQMDESILVSTNIKDLLEDCILSSSRELVRFMNDSMSESEGKEWLPLFLKKCEIFFS